MKPLIDIEELTVAKNGQLICRVPELTVQRGERIGIVGGNGSGKTTLLRVLGGLERQASGKCRVDVPLSERVYVHQMPYFFRGRVNRNVAYGLAARGIGRHDRRERSRQALAQFGIEALASRRCAVLSGGERRRVALARAMVLEPRLLLLDEPFAELDEEGKRFVLQAIEEAQSATILIASPVEPPPGLVGRSLRLTGPEQTRLPGDAPMPGGIR